MSLLAISILPLALVGAAVSDLYNFKVPNWLNAGLFLAFAPAALVLGAPSGVIVEGLALGAVTLAVGFALFSANIIGGGDAKLLAAAAPWIGFAQMGAFVFNLVLAGGALALLLLAFRKAPALPFYADISWLGRLYERANDIPYAVAIAIGGLTVFEATPLFRLAVQV